MLQAGFNCLALPQHEYINKRNLFRTPKHPSPNNQETRKLHSAAVYKIAQADFFTGTFTRSGFFAKP